MDGGKKRKEKKKKRRKGWEMERAKLTYSNVAKIRTSVGQKGDKNGAQ